MIGTRVVVALSISAGAMFGQLASVPFVGCESSGQIGVAKTPTSGPMSLPVSQREAGALAYYEGAWGFGVLAPRGWHCVQVSGSSGYLLLVSLKPIEPTKVFAPAWNGLLGPAIDLEVSPGGTSGRYKVAEVIFRVFPAFKSFADGVHELMPTREIPSGRYPKDTLSYKSKSVVEYSTPAQTDGLGTNDVIKKNGDPIRGVAILVGPTDMPDLFLLSARLPPGMADLATTIIGQVERDAQQRPLP
jgi:hypothetical protein